MALLFSRGGWLLIIAFGMALVNWVAVARGAKRLEYVFKPATLLIVLVAAWVFTLGTHRVWLARFFLLGLFFSLVGDVLLMVPDDGLFLPGLIAFFAAHVAYIVGLNPTLPPPSSLVSWVILVPFALWLYRHLATALRDAGQTAMLVPVAMYAGILSFMCFSAWATHFRPGWSVAARWTVAIGATLFLASDAMLGWGRFVRPSRTLNVLVMITYHLAQIALAMTTALAV